MQESKTLLNIFNPNGKQTSPSPHLGWGGLVGKVPVPLWTPVLCHPRPPAANSPALNLRQGLVVSLGRQQGAAAVADVASSSSSLSVTSCHPRRGQLEGAGVASRCSGVVGRGDVLRHHPSQGRLCQPCAPGHGRACGLPPLPGQQAAAPFGGWGCSASPGITRRRTAPSCCHALPAVMPVVPGYRILLLCCHPRAGA